MLIYNFQKEFLGIDEHDLKILGFHSLAELRTEVTDFADLFVKTPGYIHNFQHVHWIDFVNYADVSEEPKVIINVRSKTFKATLSISTLYLIDNPSAPAYMIRLNNLQPVTKSETAQIADDLKNKELPKVEEAQENKILVTPSSPPKPAYNATIAQKEFKAQEIPIDIGDLSLDLFEDDDVMPQEVQETEEDFLTIKEPEPIIETPKPAAQTKPQVKSVSKTKPTAQTKAVKTDDNAYVYDPNIASQELGLPLDLIEEFIQDFILQAREFQPEIYTAIKDGDVDNVKILSHKLKGVAANLRIEDAHEVLSAVSATHDMDVIHENLDTFYTIVTKLEGKEPQEEAIVVEEPAAVIEDEKIELDFKEEQEPLLELQDKDVPQKIDLPELADDDFLDLPETDLVLKIEDEPSVTLQEEEEKSQEEPAITFSKSAVAQEIGIDEASFNELFEDFIQESTSSLQNIKTALASDDLQRCHNEALKMKGMSDNIVSNDKNEIMQATDKIEAVLQKISEKGA